MSLRTPALVVFSMLTAAPYVWAEELPRFPAGSVWNQNISAAPLHADSASMITTLVGLGGFGNSRMQIDFSLLLVHASPGAPTRTIVSHPDDYFLPDCEPLGTAMPVPVDAVIEGGTGVTCDNTNQDCHLLVVQGNVLYEAYAATESSPTEMEAQCLAIWQLGVVYPLEGRGDHCTSADAAGFPIAPLMFNADDIKASLDADATGDGDLGHAIRFILNNDRMASDVSLPGSVAGRLYVRPATHAGGPSGPVESVPYGARLRLRNDFPLDNYNPAARVILNTFKRYGIVLADGGTIALTAENDFYTTKKWTDPAIDIGSRVFDQTTDAKAVDISDFEVIDTGARIAETYDCVRAEVTQIFTNGFESGDTTVWSNVVP